MKIALIGAPGSGKTELADTVWQELYDTYGDLVILDGFDKRLKDAGIIVGEDSTYEVTLAMHSEQYREEHVRRSQNISFIACGTPIERLAHTAVRLHQMETRERNDEWVRQAFEESRVAELLTAVLFKHWSYDYAFFLPHPSSDTVDGPDIETFGGLVDLAVQTAMTDFGIDPQVLLGDNQERAAKLVSTIAYLERKREAEGGESSDADGAPEVLH